MAPALVEANLGPQYLIQQHYAEAAEELVRLQASRLAQALDQAAAEPRCANFHPHGA